MYEVSDAAAAAAGVAAAVAAVEACKKQTVIETRAPESGHCSLRVICCWVNLKVAFAASLKLCYSLSLASCAAPPFSVPPSVCLSAFGLAWHAAFVEYFGSLCYLRNPFAIVSSAGGRRCTYSYACECACLCVLRTMHVAVLVVSCVCVCVCVRSVFKSGGRIQRLFWPRWLCFTSARFKYPVNMKTVGQVDA